MHCELCNYTAKNAFLWNQHLNSKKHIKLNPTTTPIKDGDIVSLLTKQVKMLMESNIRMTKEIEQAKIERENTRKELNDINKELLSLRSQLSKNKANTIVEGNYIEKYNDNSVNHNTVNIQINPFGQETWKNLSDEEVLRIMRGVNECVPELVKKLHFETPENRNVKIPNKKLPTIETFNGTTWEASSKVKTIDTWIKNIVDKLDSDYGEEFKRRASSFLQELWGQKCNVITNENSKDHKKTLREIRKAIEYTILNNREK